MKTAECKTNLDSFPTTRYQGSKRKLAAWIVESVADLEFETVLDAFGGTGAVAYAFKRAGKAVTYNDILAFNHQIGTALIENVDATLSNADIESIGSRRPGVENDNFIERTFDGIYFTREENRWLDVAVANIRAIECRFRRAIGWYALFQASLIKRPYNLFHRGNLYMRTADVSRGFGNKASWDRSFGEHFQAFANEANRAVFAGPHPCRATCQDVLAIEGEFDLIYIDPPYVNQKGIGVDYREFYHFLEGMVMGTEWAASVDVGYKHLPLRRLNQPWCDARRITRLFAQLFERFRNSILVVS
ncbi:MAG: DNA adenine methylase, partial [Planctomycetes bacterium]|nr:DNA adenine methylase [Planctomycetota bacterium]